jgi:hypothetical protein
MSIEVFPSPQSDGKYPLKLATKVYFTAGNFTTGDLAMSASTGKKLVIKGVRISLNHLGNDTDHNHGVFVMRATNNSINLLNTFCHMVASPSTWQFDFPDGLVLDSTESVYVAYRETSGSANLVVTIWAYEI